MLPDRLQSHRLVVLADDSEHDPSSRQGLQLSLKVHKRLAYRIMSPEREVLPALIPHDAAPQRIVQIDDHQLPRPTTKSAKGSLHVPGGRLEHLICEGYLGHVPESGVEGLLTGRLDPRRGVEWDDVRPSIEVLQQP